MQTYDDFFKESKTNINKCKQKQKTHEDQHGVLCNQGMNSGAAYINARLLDKAEKPRQIYSPRDKYCIYLQFTMFLEMNFGHECIPF